MNSKPVKAWIQREVARERRMRERAEERDLIARLVELRQLAVRSGIGWDLIVAAADGQYALEVLEKIGS